MKCLVTGAAGFIGSTLTDALLQRGDEVIGVDCFVDYYPRERKESNLRKARENKNFSFHEANIAQINLRDLLDGVDFVFHQAAQAGVRASWGKDFSTYTTHNILATQRLLETACLPEIRATLKRIVFASSSSVYGDAETLPTSEDLRPQPVSPYGVTKLAAENLMALYAKEHGLPTISLRYFTVYGPRQRPDMAFHRFIAAGLRGEEIRVFGDGEQTRDFTFVDDIVAANISAAEVKEHVLIYNIGGGARVTLNSVIKAIGSVLGTELRVHYELRQAGDARHTAADIQRAKADLNYQPRTELAQGLQREAKWLEDVLRQGRV